MIPGAAWPEPLDPRDPFADAEPVELEAAWAVYRARHPEGTLTPAEVESASTRVIERLRALRTGDARWPDAELDQLCALLGLTGPAPHERHAPKRPPTLPDDGALARLAADVSPAVGNDAPERILGPWAATLDARRPDDRRLLVAALAAACMAPTEDEMWGRSPLDRWLRRRPRLPTDFRQSLHAVAQAPYLPWRILEVTPAGWRLDPLLPVSAPHVPEGPVAVPVFHSVHGAGAPGDTLLARVAHPRTGWQAIFAFAVRGEPPVTALRSELSLLLLRARLEAPAPSIEHTLARSGHALVRLVHEWAWATRAA